MVLGYGRIGKVLCNILASLGASVTASARNCTDLAWIRSLGYNPLHTNDIDSIIGDCDIIFNTIPAVVLDRRILSLVSKDSLIIDLSSKPGGVDFYLDKVIVYANDNLSFPMKNYHTCIVAYMVLPMFKFHPATM